MEQNSLSGCDHPCPLDRKQVTLDGIYSYARGRLAGGGIREAVNRSGADDDAAVLGRSAYPGGNIGASAITRSTS